MTVGEEEDEEEDEGEGGWTGKVIMDALQNGLLPPPPPHTHTLFTSRRCCFKIPATTAMASECAHTLSFLYLPQLHAV